MAKYYIIAGEASGDLHGSALIKHLVQYDPTANIRGWGGEKMEAAGATIVKDYRDLAFMGFAEVLKNLGTIMQNFKACKKDIQDFQPDAIICIDYPGFNLRMTKWAKEKGYKTFYYISPQIWAWKEGRIKTIKKYVDRMIVILPFEKDFYAKHKFPVHYVGHPLADLTDQFKISNSGEDHLSHLPTEDVNIVALLPGSRKQEILIKLPIMLRMAARFPNYKFIVAKAPGIENQFYTNMLQGYDNVYTVVNKTYPLLSAAKAALVTSGTATLETALFFVPQIICYKGSKLSYELAKRLIKIKYIGLVNLILDKPLIKELIQDELNEMNLAKELEKILHDTTRKADIQKGYKELYGLLRNKREAASLAAEIIYKAMI